MNCTNCHQPLEPGAAFCGNCGHPVDGAASPETTPASPSSLQNQVISPTPVSPAAAQTRPSQAGLSTTLSSNSPPPGIITNPAATPPAYALATPAQHTGEVKALLSLVFGIAGLIGSLLIAACGLIFGLAGIVMGTLSWSGTKRRLSTIGLIVSSLAVVAGLLAWVLAPNSGDTSKTQGPVSTFTASNLTTPCYYVNFVDTLNVSYSKGGCDMSAFNGKTLNNSTNAYKVYAHQTPVSNDAAFNTLAKQAIEKDVKNSLKGFGIDSEQAALFAGSPAYIVHTSSKTQKIAVVEAAVLHTTSTGKNVFILVHADTDKTADLSTLEAQWQWK